jgi:hypothetical protein
MELVAIGASIDYRVVRRDGASMVEFTWAGFDEMNPTSGRGWAWIDGNMMSGKLFVHQGDESSFVARRERVTAPASASKAPRSTRGARARLRRGPRHERRP